MLKVQGELRAVQGKSACRRLRRQKWLPGILHRKGHEAVKFQIPQETLVQAQGRLDLAQTEIELELSGGQGLLTHRVRISEVQRHPWKNLWLHVDFEDLSV